MRSKVVWIITIWGFGVFSTNHIAQCQCHDPIVELKKEEKEIFDHTVFNNSVLSKQLVDLQHPPKTALLPQLTSLILDEKQTIL